MGEVGSVGEATRKGVGGLPVQDSTVSKPARAKPGGRADAQF